MPMLVKMSDLRHNTDIRRLRGITQKDIDRMAKYNIFYLEIQAKMQQSSRQFTVFPEIGVGGIGGG